MPCYIINYQPPSREEYDLWVEQGYTATFDEYLFYRELLRRPFGVTFMTGDLGDHCAASNCADLGIYLCDYPVGEGKTCDRPLCNQHAKIVGEDMHYCTQHYREWSSFNASAIKNSRDRKGC